LTPTLINNIDLFAWSAADLPDVDPQVAVHNLSINKEARYVSQKKRKLGEERQLAAKVEANKLLNAWLHRESPLHHLAIQRDSGKKSKWQMANVC